jgi:hypothetical protein
MSPPIETQEAPLSPSNPVFDEVTPSNFYLSAAEILAQTKAESKERLREQAEARTRKGRLFEAIRRVRYFTGDELKRELGRTPDDREFLEHWAPRIAELGGILDDRELAECLKRSSPAREKNFAIQIVKLGGEGLTGEIIKLLEEVERISEPPAPNFSGRVNDWLRHGLIEEIFAPKARSPIGNTDQNVSLPRAITSQVSERPLSLPQDGNQLTRRREQPATPKFENWAIGLEHSDVWHIFKKFGDAWRHQRRLSGLSTGMQANLFKGFAEGSGFLSDHEATKRIRKTYDQSDRRRILKRIKPEISHMRSVIRAATHLTDTSVDPLPRDRNMHGWQARIQIGYAIKEDGKLQFKTWEHLTTDETLDFSS